MAPILFRMLLLLVSAYAFLRGSRDEKIVAAICVIGALATHFSWRPLDDRLAGIEWGVLTVDLFVLAGFVAVALSSQRFWPLWVAGLQLTATSGHLLKTLNLDLLPRAYGASLMFWSYPIVIIVAIGTWRFHQRGHSGEPRELMG